MVKGTLKKIPVIGQLLSEIKHAVAQTAEIFATLFFYAKCNYFPSRNPSVNITDQSHQNSNGRGLFSLIIEVLDIVSAFGEKNIFVNYRNTAYNENANDNMWEYYFEPVNNDKKKKYRLLLKIRPLRNPFLSEDKFLRSIFCEILTDRIVIKKNILLKAKNYAETNFAGKKILGVHYRGTDIGVTIDNWSHFLAKAPIEKYFESIEKIFDGYDLIFLATDDTAAFNKFRDKCGTKLLFYSTIRNVGRVSIHHNTSTPRLAGEEAIIDAILLSKCDYFLHGHSNLATFTRLLNPNLPAKNLDLKK